MPRDMEGQARAALENLKRGLEAVGATFADVVTADRFVTDLSDQDAFNRVWESPETLPTKAEIAEPPRWIARVHA